MKKTVPSGRSTRVFSIRPLRRLVSAARRKTTRDSLSPSAEYLDLDETLQTDNYDTYRTAITQDSDENEVPRGWSRWRRVRNLLFSSS